MLLSPRVTEWPSYSRQPKQAFRGDRSKTKGGDLKTGSKVRTPPWGALIGTEPTGCAYTSLWTASFLSPFCSLDQEALQELLVKPAYRNLLVSAVGIGRRGNRKLGTSLLKESFCDRAKPSGVIFDSSNSFIPHIQAVRNPVSAALKMYRSTPEDFHCYDSGPRHHLPSWSSLQLFPNPTPGFCSCPPSLHHSQSGPIFISPHFLFGCCLFLSFSWLLSFSY